MRPITKFLIICLLCWLPASLAHMQEQPTEQSEEITLRILWFDDFAESLTLREQLDAFTAQHENVTVNLELLSSTEVNDAIWDGLRRSEPPDLARTNLPGSYRRFYLDLRPYLSDPEAWESNFNPDFLASLRDNPDDNGLHGYPADVTISAPYINRDLWQQAGVPIPTDVQDTATWDDWVMAATQVQAALSTRTNPIYALAIDRSGHRFWGLSIGFCADYLSADAPYAVPQIDTPGFRDAAATLLAWHREALVPVDVWASGAPATEYFVNGQVAFYYSGNWHLSEFERRIEDFNWQVVPNPEGPCGQTGMVGGTTVVAFEGTDYPELVGQLVDFLTQQDNLQTFYEENILLPGHTGIAQGGMNYPEGTEDEIAVFRQELANAAQEAYMLQFHPESASTHAAIRDGLIELINDRELTINDAIERIRAGISG